MFNFGIKIDLILSQEKAWDSSLFKGGNCFYNMIFFQKSYKGWIEIFTAVLKTK